MERVGRLSAINASSALAVASVAVIAITGPAEMDAVCVFYTGSLVALVANVFAAAETGE